MPEQRLTTGETKTQSDGQATQEPIQAGKKGERSRSVTVARAVSEAANAAAAAVARPVTSMNGLGGMRSSWGVQ